MTPPLDLLAWLEDALAAARTEAAAAVDKAEALAELRSLALERAGELGVPTLTFDDFESGLATEQERATFNALALRATTNEREDSPRAA